MKSALKCFEKFDETLKKEQRQFEALFFFVVGIVFLIVLTFYVFIIIMGY